MTPRLRDVVVIVAFGVALLVTVVAPWWGRDRLEPAAVVAVVGAHAGLVQAGDTVIVHPPWRDDIVDALRTGVSLPRDVVVTEAFTRGHGEAWPAVVVVAEGVHPWPASLEARRLALGVDVVEDRGVRLFRLPADAVKGGIDLGRATVHVEMADGGRVACPWDARMKRHVCKGLSPWMTVGDDVLQVGGRRETCTWSHPISGGRVVIDHGLVDVGGGVHLEAALSDAAVDNPTGAAVTYSLRLSSGATDEAQTLTVQRAKGFAAVDVPGRPGTARLQVIVSTDDDGQRHTCHRLRVGKAGGP